MNRTTSYRILFVYALFGLGLTTVDDLLGDIFHITSPWKNILGLVFDSFFLLISVLFLYTLMRRIFASEERIRQSEKLNLAGQLAAGIAHEIRNPLTSLNGFLDILPSATPQKQRDYRDIMKSELARIENIVNEMLILAKPHATNFVTRDMQQVLDEVIFLMTPSAVLRNISIVKSVPSASMRTPLVGLTRTLDAEAADQSTAGAQTLEWTKKQEGAHCAPETIMRCEDGQIKQVFINVIKNALEAMPQGGTLDINMEVKGDELSIYFKDTGEGIPKTSLARLGEPFYTTKSTGTGLGLLICKRILHAHRGAIHITSELGAGTTVQITLPLTESQRELRSV